MEQNPEILHLSYRSNGEDSEYKWLRVNVVFRVFEEHDRITCDVESSEWMRSTLWEIDDPEKIDLHFMHTKMKWVKAGETGLSRLERWVTDPEYDISSTKRTGWQSNPSRLLTKLEKFDVYRYSDYVEDNPVTRGAISILEELRTGCYDKSRFVAFSALIRSLRVLNTFWD